MSSSASNIRVFIEWNEPTVFAGEDVGCRITFKNTAAVYGTPRPTQATPTSTGLAPGGERQRKHGSLQAPSSNARPSPKLNAHNQQQRSSGHRSVVSLNSPSGRGQTFGSWGTPQNGTADAGHKHKRSLSIVSMGIEDNGQSSQQNHGEPTSAQRPGRNHARAASLQVMPRWNGQSPGGPKTGASMPHLLNKVLLLLTARQPRGSIELQHFLRHCLRLQRLQLHPNHKPTFIYPSEALEEPPVPSQRQPLPLCQPSRESHQGRYLVLSSSRAHLQLCRAQLRNEHIPRVNP